MAFRVSLWFTMQGDRLGGWSENFWLDVSDRSTALAATELLATALQSAKGDQPYCSRYRLSDPALFRSGKTYLREGAAPRAGTSFPSDYATTKWLIQLNSSSRSTVQWQGGMSDNSVVNGGRFLRSVESNPTWQDVRTILSVGGQPWSIRVLDTTIPLVNILSIDPATGLVTAPGHLLATGNQVRVKGVRGLVQANGLWRVFVPTGSTDTFQLPNWVASTQPMTRSNASVRRQAYIYQKIIGVSVIRASNHKIGRPPGLHGGKPKKKKTA